MENKEELLTPERLIHLITRHDMSPAMQSIVTYLQKYIEYRDNENIKINKDNFEKSMLEEKDKQLAEVHDMLLATTIKNDTYEKSMYYMLKDKYENKV